MLKMEKRRTSFPLVVVFLGLLIGNAAGQDNVQLFTNGSIYIDGDRKADSLLVINGLVKAIGVNPEVYKNATVVDLNGAAAYPGFIDSHVHLVEAGYGFSSGCDLYGADDADAICKTVGPIAARLPKGEPMFGGGFSLEDYDAWSLEDLSKLDNVTGDRPVFLGDQLGHNAIVNSAAMEICNISSDTKVPIGGKIVCQNGMPTGMLRESAMTLVGNVLFPKFSEDQIRPVAKKFFDYWASFGYTSINDLSGFSGGRMLKPDMLKKMEKDGELPIRVNFLYTLFSLDEIYNALQYVGKDTEQVRFIGLKIFVDGAFAGGQAWTSWENMQGNHGLNYVYADDSSGKNYNITRIVEKADQLNLDVHYHVQGDMAIGAVLDALDKVEAKHGKLNSTHTLIHLAFLTDEDVARIKKFNGSVVTTVQPAFWRVEENLTRYYGNRIEDSYPMHKLLDANVSVGISTDFGVSPLDISPPTAIIEIASTGAGDPEHHLPISVRDVINGLTVGSAATTPKKDIGRLDIGYKADMVVYDQDLYSVPLDKFTKDNPAVLATYISGKQVYFIEYPAALLRGWPTYG